MRELTLTIPDDPVAALAESPEEAGADLRMLAAVKLFELKKLSSGAAARLAGVSRVITRPSSPPQTTPLGRPR